MAENETAKKLEPENPAQSETAPVAPAPQPAAAEPLPIWFFVGLVLLVYGLIVLFSGLFVTPTHQTVLAETRPGIWWGAIMSAAGAVFLVAGLRIHRRGR